MCQCVCVCVCVRQRVYEGGRARQRHSYMTYSYRHVYFTGFAKLHTTATACPRNEFRHSFRLFIYFIHHSHTHTHTQTHTRTHTHTHTPTHTQTHTQTHTHTHTQT